MTIDDFIERIERIVNACITDDDAKVTVAIKGIGVFDIEHVMLFDNSITVCVDPKVKAILN